VAFADAIRYSEIHHIEVVNASFGWTFEQKGVNRRCGNNQEGVTGATLPEMIFMQGMMNSTAAYAALFPSPSRTLYVFAAGNNSYDVDEAGVFDVPSEALRTVANVAPGLVIVGSALDRANKAPSSSYGSSGGVDLFAPGVNWTSLLATGRPCECRTKSCRDGSGALLSVCLDTACPLDGTTGSICLDSGTSMASPVVASAAALLLASTTRLRGNPGAVRTALTGTATLINGFAICGSQSFPGRLLDAAGLLEMNAP